MNRDYDMCDATMYISTAERSFVDEYIERMQNEWLNRTVTHIPYFDSWRLRNSADPFTTTLSSNTVARLWNYLFATPEEIQDSCNDGLDATSEELDAFLNEFARGDSSAD